MASSESLVLAPSLPELVEVTAHIVPSRWIRKRIVGITDSRGEEHWTAKRTERTNLHDYDPSSSEELTLPLDTVLSQRLISFFDRYFADKSRSQEDSYNCHKFALWMTGATIPQHSNDPYLTAAVDPIIAEGVRQDTPLGLGQMGVIGFKEGVFPRSCHSVIGLGEDVPECLQVMAIEGHLAIDSYENRLSHAAVSNRMSQQDYEFGLYVQHASNR